MSLQKKLNRGEFVITAEIAPPLAASADALMKRAGPLAGLADAVNITDAASARAAMASLPASAILVQNGIEPVLQLTCRDRNRIAIASDLIGAAALGISNLLILHGDDPTKGDMPDAKPVFDLDSRGVMALVKQMRDEGQVPSGRAIDPAPHLHIGCADMPIDPADDWEPKGLKGKIESGAQFAQTQFCFDLGMARRYFARLKEHGVTDKLKFIVGIGPLLSVKQATFMNENLFGVTIPDATMARLEAADDEKAEGRKICIELMEGMQEIDGIAGVHIMAPMQSGAAIAQVIKDSGLKG